MFALKPFIPAITPLFFMQTAASDGSINTAVLNGKVSSDKQPSRASFSEIAPERMPFAKEASSVNCTKDNGHDVIGKDLLKEHQKELEWTRKKLLEQDEQMKVKDSAHYKENS